MELQKLGKYEVVSKIGEGAMGEVYKAYDPVLGREVAVKTMSAAIGADNELRQRFQREAQSAARMNHPNIITVYDFGEEQGRAYIAMELLEGDDLNDLIARQAPMSLGEKVGLMEQMADGLAFAHARDVVHRDLKPANIHIQRGNVKIMDFGLARLSTSNMTRAGMVMGTPNYMSPEQVRGERATARSDVFSLGAVFYELLTYHKPFDADSLHAVLYQVMQSEPEPIAKAVPGLPNALREVVETAMAKDPARRYPNAGDLLAALRTARGSLSGFTRTEALAPSPAPAPFDLAPTPVPTARSPITAAAGPSTAVAIVPDVSREATQVAAAPVATIAHDLETLPGRAATQVPPHPAPPPSRPATRRDLSAARPPSIAGARAAAPAPPAAKATSRLPIAAGGAALAMVLGVVAFRLLQGPQPVDSGSTPSPTTASPTSPPTVEPVEVVVSIPSTVPDLGPWVTDARRSLEARDYRTAAARAEAVLARDRGNSDAQRVLEEARAAVRRGETAARELKAALDGGDADGAYAALTRLNALDPRNPEVTALTLRVNEALGRKTVEQQRLLEQARRQPLPTPVPTPVPPVQSAPPTPVPTAPPTPVPAASLPAPGPVALTPAQLETARKAIRGVLDEYRAAVETRNAEYLRRLQPGVNYDAMKATLAAVAGMDVKIEVKEVSVSGDAATASCLVTYTPNPKPAGKIPPVPTTFRLKNTGSIWIIEDVVRR